MNAHLDRSVAFVVLDYNGGEAVLACIDSVLAQRDVQVECVVVDNGSTDGSLERIRARFGDRVRVVALGRNTGFAGGMNAGTRASNAAYVAHVNQDVVLSQDYGARAIELFESDPSVGAVGGRVLQLQEDGPTEELDAAGWYLRGRLAVGRIESTPPEPVPVFGVSGACPVFRRAMLEDIRLEDGEFYDEFYFLYYEDIDLFFRAQLRSWRVLYAPDMLAWHHRSMSSGGGRRFYDKPFHIQTLHMRNRYLTAIKNVPAGLLTTLGPRMLAAELALLPYLLVRSPRSLAALGVAWVRTLRALPRALRLRRRIQAERKAGPADLRALMRGV